MHHRWSAILLLLILPCTSRAARLFIPMSADGQANHLKAYGIVFAALEEGAEAEWLLNYKGGSFAITYSDHLAHLCEQRGVTCSKMSTAEYTQVIQKVKDHTANGEVVRLTRAPRIAVYTPPGKKPWDDAVTMALTYAEIPFDKLYADEVLAGSLDKYDWLHLHHEDFTGQYGKFWMGFHTADWYIEEQRNAEDIARRNGFRKVSQMQLAVVKRIRAFIAGGGNLFAMCTATDTYDIALAAEGQDICPKEIDGDTAVYDPSKMNYKNCLAFRNFFVFTDIQNFEFSTIDNTINRGVPQIVDSFKLNSFPPDPDPVPAMLCQNHQSTIASFMGMTTAFNTKYLKPGVVVLAAQPKQNEARYIHGDLGQGTWTFYGGHDPEDYQHLVNDPPTDLSQHPNSPGYRLILNNVLFPAANRKAVPTVYYSKESTGPVPVAIDSTGKIPMDKNVVMTANPISNELTISMTRGAIQEIVIRSNTGHEVFRKKYAGISSTGVSLRDISSGIYLVQINGEFAGKMVKD